MTELLGQGQRLLTPLLGLVGITQLPEWSENPRIACDPGVKPTSEEWGGGRRDSRDLQTLLEVGTGRDEVAEVERVTSYNHMARLHQVRIRLALCQVEELPTQRFAGAQAPVPVMKSDEAPERPEEVAGLSHLLAQRVGPAIGFSGFVRGHAPGNHQQLSQYELERELTLGALGALRQHRDERQPRPEGSDGFGIRIPLGRIITDLLPILDSTPDLTAALEVDSQPDGDLPGLCTIPCLQPFTNAPVELHPPRRPDLLIQHLPVERMGKLIAPTAGAIRPLA